MGGYGVLRCRHIMHLHCRLEYEAYERGRAPFRLPRCSICAAPFKGFGCICLLDHVSAALEIVVVCV